MNTSVITCSPKELKRLRQQLEGYLIANASPYVAFAAKYQAATITAYTSGKVVIQGKTTAQIAADLGLSAKTTRTASSSLARTFDQACPLIGSDEVGNGSYFGGIAVVASYVTPTDQAWLKEIGVDDSKNLNDQRIQQLAPLLEARIPHQALLLSPKKYNQLVGKDKPYNAVSIKVALHNQAIYLLLNKGYTPQKIVIDAFTSQKNYEKHLRGEKNHFPNALTFMEKAESQVLAVAVSSIIARNLFLANLKQLSEELGYQLPSGAGKASDQVAADLLRAYGMEALTYSAKQHFANTRKAQQLSKSFD
ncbi:ribonuclease HIII [Streptococcus halichoeri]|uniref:ribonuclease HIII n=1 Tax=Streptococcus halichoeri TaxID=254785 RepID=UPI001C8E535D|nr:ribonuclease HIII [Streptococcus halichoeri]